MATYNIKPIRTKKSQGFEGWFLVIVILLTFSIFFIILNKAWGEIKSPLDEGLQSSMPADSSVNVSKVLNQTTNAGLTFDKLMPFLIIGLFAFVLILTGGIIQHPIMIFVGIIILGVVILLATVYSNMYDEITSTSEFSATKSQMPIQDKFMRYMPVIIFIMAIGVTIYIMIRKSGGGGNY